MIGRPLTVALLIVVASTTLLLADEPKPEEGNFSGSLIFSADRDVSQTLTLATEEIRRGDISAGLVRLQRLLDRPTDALAVRGNSYISVWEAANQIIGALPDGHQGDYDNHFGVRANQELAAARRDWQREALVRLTDQYRHTNAGREAAVLLATLAFDRGDSKQAAHWMDFIEQEQSATPPGLPIARSDGKSDAPRRPTAPNDATAKNSEASPIGDAIASDNDTSWTIDFGIVPAGRRAIADALGEFDAQALTPILTCQPLLIGNRIVTRTLHGLVCVNAVNGKRHWEHRLPSHASQLAHRPGELNNPIRNGQATAIFLRRLIRDSLEDELTTDGDRVFAINVNQSANEDWKDVTVASQLMAIDIATGETVWTLPAAKRSGKAGKAVNRKDDAKEWFTLGPPLVDGEQLLVLAQRSNSVEIVALSAATGDIEWTIPIAKAARDLSKDRERLSTACVLSKQGSRLLCSTAVGAVVCVDSQTRRIVWAHRLPRTDLPQRSMMAENFVEMNENRVRRELPIRDAWTIARSWQFDDRGICICPEVDRLMAFDMQTGRVLWSRERGDQLDAPLVDGERLITIGTSGVAAIDLVDGSEIWFAATSPPIGRGFIDEGRLTLPVTPTQWARIRLTDGTVLTEGNANERSGGMRVTDHPPTGLQPTDLHNLSQFSASPHSLSPNGISQPGQLQQGQLQLGNVLIVQSSSSLRRINAAEAVESSTPPAQESWAAHVVPFLMMQSEFHAMTDMARQIDGRLSLLDSLFALLIDVTNLRELAAEAVVARSLRSDLSETPIAAARVDSLIDTLQSLHPQQLYVTSLDEPWTSRLDRWLQGYRDTGGSSSTEDRDLERAPTDPPETTPTSTPTSPVAADQWPPATPRVTERPSGSGPSYSIRVPMNVAQDSPWNTVTVEVDRHGRYIQFQRASDAQPAFVKLPPSNNLNSYDVAFLHAWAPGDVLILRIGTDLMAWQHSPTGDLPTKPLWSDDRKTISLLGPQPPMRASFQELAAHQTPRWNGSTPGFADAFGRDIGEVGPVQSAYVCYQQRGHLIALDPLTGKELWRRSRLPIQTRCLGDDRFVVLFHPTDPMVTVLSATDGRRLHEWDRNERPGDHRPSGEPKFVRGVMAVDFDETQPNAELIAVDMLTGEDRWRRILAAGDKPFAIDDHQLGVATAAKEGTSRINLLDWTTGDVIDTADVNAPGVVHDVYTFSDDQSAYVILSDQVSAPSLLTANQIRGGFGRPEVDGWLHAFELQGTKHRWSCRLDNLAFPLHQPRHVPLLIVNDDVQSPPASALTGRLMCIDKRSGEMIASVAHTIHVYYAIDANRQAGTIDLRMQGRQLHFDFNPHESND